MGLIVSVVQCGYFYYRGVNLYVKYMREGNPTDLAEAIVNHRKILDLCPPGHLIPFFRPISLNSLAEAFQIRYQYEGNLADAALAIQYCQEALDLCPPGHRGRPVVLNNLGKAIMVRFQHEGNLDDLTLAIEHWRDALGLCPPGNPGRPVCLTNLAQAFQARFECEGNLDDVTLAVQYSQEALNLCPPGHPGRIMSLNNLAQAIRFRYEREGNLADATLAMQYCQEALSLCPPGHPGRPMSLNNLSQAILTRYRREGNLDDVTLAIQYCREALDLHPPRHPDRPALLNGLTRAIEARYQREGNLDDITLAIQNCQEALDLSPPGHPGRPAALLGLANAMRVRYEREGNLADLTLAIQHLEEVLGLVPTRHPGRSEALNSLAHTIMARYKREGSLEDLTLVIQYCQDALDLCSPWNPGRPVILNNMASAIAMRYQRRGNSDDLALAIKHYREALDLNPPGHPGRFVPLGNLANAIETRYQRERNPDDLKFVIQQYQEALEFCPPGNPYRIISLTFLANAIESRYQREGNLDDLTLAIQYYQEVLDLCPSGHPDRSASLHKMARALQEQYSAAGPRHGSEDPLKHTIIHLLREASQSTTCSPRDCLRASLSWVEISKSLVHDSTLEAYSSASEQLNIVLALGESLNQRHDRLLDDEISAKTKDLGVDAAMWALQHGELQRAVELLEQGRSLLLAQIGRYRVELDDLRLLDPELAYRFARLSHVLDASVVSNQMLDEANPTIKDPYERYRKVSMEWNRTVEGIRGLQGFETFLKPTPYEKLREAAAEGPVVLLIPNEDGSAALIIRNDAPIHHIDLPHATSDRLAELSSNFTHALNYTDHNDAQRERECVDNLASLWNEVVGPIAEALQHDLAIPLRSRVWWCPTSVACFLPLHAAGLYAKGKTGENFLDKYISSYTTTLQALLRARRTDSTAPKRLLVISQPNTPDEPPLPYARDEVDKIEKIMSPNGAEPSTEMTSLASEAGTCEAIQREMTSHPWIHFICHGVQAAKQPLDSYLSLHDGHLTLRKIIEQNVPNADFAFLAACHSAAGDQDLANEALHLAAAMQFAGFRGVVGTLWKMRDVDGPPLAEAFYKDMVKRGDHRRAAVALSKAINQLRRNKVPIHCWMRFVHIGA